MYATVTRNKSMAKKVTTSKYYTTNAILTDKLENRLSYLHTFRKLATTQRIC